MAGFFGQNKRLIKARLVFLRAKLWSIFYYEFRSDVRALARTLWKERPVNKACFIFGTKNRPQWTKAALASMALSKNFDVIWLDASADAEALDLFEQYRSPNFNIIARVPQIKHGPDVAIELGLMLLYHSNYEYIGLIENDTLFKKDWLPTLLDLFAVDPGEKGVHEIGAASLRNYKARNLERNEKFSYAWNLGAGMVLFKREAVRWVLRYYGFLTSFRLRAYYRERFGIDLAKQKDPLYPSMFESNVPLAGDVKFCYNLWRHGYACVASVPTLATTMDAADPALYE